jgi:hypothetical protein
MPDPGGRWRFNRPPVIWLTCGPGSGRHRRCVTLVDGSGHSPGSDLDSSEDEMRQISNGHNTLGSSLIAAAAAVTALTFAAPAHASAIDSQFDICAALRGGTSLAAVETTLEARGYTATNAGVLTGTTIRQHCPDQTSNAEAQVR